MKKLLFITNIPVPYRIDFYNELGKRVDLTVVFEAKGAANQGIKFNYNLHSIKNFKAIFLKNGDICEKKIDTKILKYLLDEYDEVVLTSYSYYTEMAYLILRKLLRKPYYLSSDGGMIKRDENVLKKYWKKFLVSGAKGYFSPSKAADEYLEYYGAKNSRIHRYPFTSYYESERIKSPLSKEEKRKIKDILNIPYNKMVLGVGQFVHRKGWDILLNACRFMPKDIGVYIIGGACTEEYAQIAKKYGIINIHFLNFMSSEALHEYYKAADVFVLPTREDIWGLVINEAMNFGLPIITTTSCIAGLELVQNGVNGYLIENIDSANADIELSEKIVKLVENSTMKQNMEQASLDKIKGYSIEKMADSYYNILAAKSVNDDEKKCDGKLVI